MYHPTIDSRSAEGVLDPIVLMARAGRSGLRVAALNCLIVRRTRWRSATEASPVIAMFSQATSRRAARVLLWRIDELAGCMGDVGGARFSASVALSEDTNTKGEASRAIANLAANADVQQTLLKEGVLLPMVKALEIDDINCQRFSALCLANLATTIASQIKVVQAGAIRPLVALAHNPTGHSGAATRLALANRATVAGRRHDRGGRPCFRCGTRPASCPVHGLRANLSCAVGNHTIMVEQGGLQPLITLHVQPDPASINRQRLH